MIGQVIGSYRIVRPLGEGGMGVVYLAEHALLGRRAAIKVLLPQLSTRQDIVTRFFNEARAATAIADAGIVQIFDFGFHTDGSAFIVMELLEGEPLDQRLRRHQRLAPLEALRIARQLASSLGAAHAKGIIHRDLKPENVYLVPDGEVAGGERAKILDFGIAKLTHVGTDPDPSRTQTGAIMGTPLYMSPEQCRGAGDIDHRSDIYALGCVLYHLLVGRPPFVSDGAGELIALHLREMPMPPSAYVPALQGLDALVLTCLAKAPANRYATMGELALALEQASASGGGSGNRTVGAGPGGWSTPAPSLPGRSWAPPARTPTTLGSSARALTLGATAPAAPVAKLGRWVAAGMLVALGGGGAWIATSKRRGALDPAGGALPDRGAAANSSAQAVGASAGTSGGAARTGVDVLADAAGGSAIAIDAGVAPALPPALVTEDREGRDGAGEARGDASIEVGATPATTIIAATPAEQARARRRRQDAERERRREIERDRTREAERERAADVERARRLEAERRRHEHERARCPLDANGVPTDRC